MTKKKLHEQLGLSVEETLNRMIGLGQLIHKYEQEHGEKPDLKHVQAVLHANAPTPKQGEANDRREI